MKYGGCDALCWCTCYDILSIAVFLNSYHCTHLFYISEQLKKQEEMVERQEAMRRKTAEIEADLRTKTELAKTRAEAEGRIRQERENQGYGTKGDRGRRQDVGGGIV